MPKLPRFPPDFLPGPSLFGEKQEGTLEILSRLSKDEAKAIDDYAEAAARFRGWRDMQTASMFEHIRSEEMHHLEELNKRVREITFGGKR